MNNEWLAERFEADRGRLQAVAYRLLGSASEADDAVQEAWLRLSRSDTSDVENLTGWLTTVVARICMDMLRSRQSRREEPLTLEGDLLPDAIELAPEGEAHDAKSVGEPLDDPERVRADGAGRSENGDPFHGRWLARCDASHSL